jgi:hypothetical protein
VSPHSEIIFGNLSKSLIVRKGGYGSSNQINGRSAQSQRQPTSIRGGTTHGNMTGVDNNLTLPKFQGVGSWDLEQHLFVCEKIWVEKNVQDETVKIVHLETKFRGCALVS